MSNNYPTIDVHRTGQNIRRIMQLKGLMVRDVQEFLRLSTPQSIYHWFDGRNMPTIDNLYALSELFQIPVDSILKGNRKERFGFYVRPSYRRMSLYIEKYRELLAG